MKSNIMSLEKKELIIVSSEFKNYSGHDFYHNLSLKKILEKKYNLKFYVDKKFDKNISKKYSFKKIYNIFNNPTDKYKKKYISYLSFLKKINFIKNLYLLKNKQQKKFFFINKTNYHKNLEKIILNKKKNIILFHSEMGNKFADILNFLIKNKVEKKIFCLDRVGPDQSDKFKFLIKYLNTNKYIFFLTDSKFIQKYYLKNNIITYLFPLFIQFKENIKKNKKEINICYNIGPARIEKGFLEIPEIYNILKKEKYIKHFINYSGIDNKSPEPRILNSLNKISKLDITKNEQNLDYEEYLNYLKSIDVIIFNYIESSYKEFRTSAIFYEAIANNVVPIVKQKTWASSFYKKNKILKELILNKNQDILKIITFLKKNFSSIKKEILKIKKKILSINNKTIINNILNLKKKERSKNILLLINENFIFQDLKKNEKLFFETRSFSSSKLEIKSSYSSAPELINSIFENINIYKKLNKIDLVYNSTKKPFSLKANLFNNGSFKLYKLDYKYIKNKIFKKIILIKNNKSRIYKFKTLYVLVKN